MVYEWRGLGSPPSIGQVPRPAAVSPGIGRVGHERHGHGHPDRELEPVMLQRERLRRLCPADHRLRGPADRAEQRVLKICRPWQPGSPAVRREICNAGVHGHRLLVFSDATKNGDGGFPMHASRCQPFGPASARIPASPLPADPPRSDRSYTTRQDTPENLAHPSLPKNQLPRREPALPADLVGENAVVSRHGH
jgi:hypothetical protein